MKSRRTAIPRAVIAMVAIAVIMVGVAAGQTLVAAQSQTNSTSSSAESSTTSPCGSPGVYCGNVQITSGSLTVNGSDSILRVAILEVGNSYIGSATVYVNGTVIGVPPTSQYEPPGNIILNVQPGQGAVLTLTIPSNSLSVEAGRTYSIMVYAWLGPPGQRASSGVPGYATIVAGNAVNGIGLSASISATSIPVGQNISATMSIFNTLPTVNDVPTSSDWPFQGVNVAMWGGCIIGYPVQVAVLSGNYTAQELPSVANTTLQYVCFGEVSIDHVILQPNSDQATLTGIGPAPNLNQTLGPISQALTFSTAGYWNLTTLSQERDINIPIIGHYGNPVPATAFVPGTYTVAVEDEWGQALVLHFVVTPSGATGPSTSTTTIALTTTTQTVITTQQTVSCCPLATFTSIETVTGPTTTVTSTQTVTLSTIPTWAYATMAAFLIAGVAVGYVLKRPPTTSP